jgi:hypothetical protein
VSADIYNVFHVSQLKKKHLGPRAIPQVNLPLVTPNGYVKVEPIVVLDTRALPYQDDIVTQWLVLINQLGKISSSSKQLSLAFTSRLKEWWPDGASCG